MESLSLVKKNVQVQDIWFGNAIQITVAKIQWTTMLRSDYGLIKRDSNDNAGKTDRRGFKGAV